MNEILCGDALTELKKIPNESVDTIITSPPYWGLRDYGVEGQLGLEKTPEEYVAKMVEVFREVKRVLKKQGTCWLNLGDSYATQHETGTTDNKKGWTSATGIGGRQLDHARAGSGGLPSKNLVGIPWRVAFALQSDGWYLRQDIIWAKPNPMPESVTDRCTKSHEYIFLLAKSQKYYFDNEAIWEPAAESSIKRIEYGLNQNHPEGIGIGMPPVHTDKMGKRFLRWKESIADPTRKNWQSGNRSNGINPDRNDNDLAERSKNSVYAFRNRRSVWTITTKPFKEAHFATFPEDLITPMILAGCPKEGIVLDPFMGSGTTAVVARKLNRNYLGIELNPKYIEIANRRLAQQKLL